MRIYIYIYIIFIFKIYNVYVQPAIDERSKSYGFA